MFLIWEYTEHKEPKRGMLTGGISSYKSGQRLGGAPRIAGVCADTAQLSPQVLHI